MINISYLSLDFWEYPQCFLGHTESPEKSGVLLRRCVRLTCFQGGAARHLDVLGQWELPSGNLI